MNPKLQRIARRVDDDDLLMAFSEARRRHAKDAAEPLGNATVVTSAAGREGKTHVALRLAIQSAKLHGRRTLLVDAAPDRRGSVSRLVADPVRASAEGSDSVCAATGLPNLDLLSWGPQIRRRLGRQHPPQRRARHRAALAL